MTFKIEKGVPLSTLPRGESIYPFADMAPGDSFAATVPEGKTAKYFRSRLTGAAHTWAKRHAKGAKFATRVEPDGKSVRIWLLSRPQPLAPLATVMVPVPPPSGVARVHKLKGDDEPAPARRGRPPKQFTHDIPSFTDGAKPRAVKGSRY